MINMLERSTRLELPSNIPELKLMPRPKGRRRKLQGDRSRSGRGARVSVASTACWGAREFSVTCTPPTRLGDLLKSHYSLGRVARVLITN